MELWGGIECTLNRVGDRRFDQLDRSGHYQRPDDLEKIAALGIRTMRYPLLWERAAGRSVREYDWRFADERLARLRGLGVRPIVGLVHHGSGPDDADVASERFAPGLADYARALATRFPWVDAFTPVNEPLTTARFCGLYGHWYPHARDERTFARALFNQCRATVLAMREIRAVNPAAQLVQTEDLGTIYSSPRLGYQAAFENERRWLGWDLLCGYVDAAHPLHAHLLAWGLSRHELDWLRDNACPPDVIGIDHYVTSDRYLDENLERYPGQRAGGNGRDVYVDVEAVRVREQPGTSLGSLLAEAATRYGLPIVLTEVHLGCAPVEQIRWLNDAWCIAQRAKEAGIDVRAATAWALLGCYDWDALLTSDRGHYEPGAFAVTSQGLDPTPLADFLSVLAAGRWGVDAGAALGEGWWRRPQRLIYPRLPENTQRRAAAHLPATHSRRASQSGRAG
jgi:dTDP-4-dehydrorhamnose reductase